MPNIIVVTDDESGPFIVWENVGYEGWHPKSYQTLKDAVSDKRYQLTFVITKRVEYEVLETE